MICKPTTKDNSNDLAKVKAIISDEAFQYKAFLALSIETASNAKAKLYSKEIEELREKDLEAFAVELVCICNHIQFHTEKTDLIRLKHLGVSSQIQKIFINIEKIQEMFNEVLRPKKNHANFVLYLHHIKILKIIEANSFCKIIDIVFKSVYKIEDFKYTSNPSNNAFTQLLKSIKKRKGTYENMELKLQNTKESEIHSTNTQKIVERLVYEYFKFDSYNVAILTEGRTEKIILAQIINQENYIMVAQDDITINEGDFIKRLFPLFQLVLPGLIKNKTEFDEKNEKKVGRIDSNNNVESYGYSKKLDAHNIANIKSKLSISWSIKNESQF